MLAREVRLRGGRALGDGRGFQRVGVGLQRAQRVGDVLERLDDRAAILRRGLVESGDGGALLVQQVPPWKSGWVTAPAMLQTSRKPGANSWSNAGAVLPTEPVRVNFGSSVGDRDADIGAGGCKCRLRRAHVGTLLAPAATAG